MKVHYEKEGCGETLVLFHGWGFDSRIWRPLAKRLAGHFEIYACDLPGYGATEPMSLDDFFHALLDFLPEKFTVLGWSLGGLWASRLAFRFPARVRRLINVCSSPCFLAQDAWPGIQAAVLERFHQQIEHSPTEVLAEFVRLQGVTEDDLAPLIASSSSDSLKEGLRQLMHWDLRDEIHHLEQPVHYLFSRLDAITPYQTLGLMQKHYPQFNYEVFKRAAHLPFLSQPEQFIEYIQKVMK